MSICIHFEGKTIQVEPAAECSVMELARQAGWHIDAKCGGCGSCASCNVLLGEGRYRVFDEEIEVQTEQRREVLSCQTYVLGDEAEFFLPSSSVISFDGARIADEMDIPEHTFNPRLKKGFGIAVDVGTTTVVAALIDLTNGKIISRESLYNQQILKADDVVSRISLCNTDGELEKLQNLVVEHTLNPIIHKLCAGTGTDSADIVHLGISGNTVMTHIFYNTSPVSIGTIPFEPVSRTFEVKAGTLGIDVNPEAFVEAIPAISGYVGGDRSQLGSDIDGEAAIDSSGWSVSLSSTGDRVAVGAPYAGSNWDAGQVRIYENSGTNWGQIGSDIDGSNGNYLGYSVSLSSAGDRVAIGAPPKSKGHVSIYEYSGGDWNQLGSDINGEANYDWFGYRVSLSSAGDRVAIGALGNDDAGDEAGHVRIYEYSGGDWTQLGSDIGGEAEGDKSGGSVSLSAAGDRVAIGAARNSGNAVEAGHVRIYEYSGGGWVQLGSDIDGVAVSNHFGSSVSLSAAGDRVAAGASGNDYAGTDAGQVRIYGYVGTNWVQLGSDINGAEHWDWAGYSVSLSAAGDRVVVGAPGPDVNPEGSDTYSAGQVRIYEYSGGDWIQLASDIDGEAAGNGSGGSVSLSSTGDRVAIGAPENDDSGDRAGHVRVYGNIVVDTDEDGLCDALEAYYSTDLANGDTDDDGDTDYAEVAMGFNPTNQWSKLDFTGWPTNDSFEVSFMTASGRLFYVESKDSLLQSNWVERVGISGTSNPTNWIEPSMDSNQFYRIKVQIQ